MTQTMFMSTNMATMTSYENKDVRAIGGSRLFNVQLAICKLPFASVLKGVFVQNHSYENVFPLQVLFHANQTQYCTRTRPETEAKGSWEIKKERKKEKICVESLILLLLSCASE